MAGFVLGNRRTAREPDELLTAVLLPTPADEAVSHFLKLGSRRYLVISIVMLAFALELRGDRIVTGRRRRRRLCPDRRAPAPAREPPHRASLRPGLERVADESCLAPLSPIDDIRATAAYRRDACLTLLRRGLADLAGGQRWPPDAMATRLLDPPAGGLHLTVNGRPVTTATAPFRRLADVLREDLGLTGTKVGCNAGDCGACTVLLDGEQVCACLVPAGQCAGRRVVTVEGLAADPRFERLRASFLAHGAAQCGICTPGMLMAAADLLGRTPRPDRAEVEDALAGVLCRCTGYLTIVDAVLDAARRRRSRPRKVRWVPGSCASTAGARSTARRCSAPTAGPRAASPCGSSARRTIVPASRWATWPCPAGSGCRLTAADVPGRNGFGIYPDLKDQPVLAQGEVRHRGEPVLALVGTARGRGWHSRRDAADRLGAAAARSRRGRRPGTRRPGHSRLPARQCPDQRPRGAAAMPRPRSARPP